MVVRRGQLVNYTAGFAARVQLLRTRYGFGWLLICFWHRYPNTE